MIHLATRILGRLPIGILQLLHNKVRLIAALSGVAFAGVLVFLQLGLAGAMMESVAIPYRMFHPDLLLVSAADADTLFDGSDIPRRRLYEALSHPGVDAGTPLFTASLTWNTPDGDSARLEVFAVDPTASGFLDASLEQTLTTLTPADTALLDRKTRFRDMTPYLDATPEDPRIVELNHRRIRTVGLFEIGGGFSGDGGLFVSDQTFLALFPSRTSAAPNHVLLRVRNGVAPQRVAEELLRFMPEGTVRVRTIAAASETEQRYQMTERPTGLVFAMGVVIGTLVGIVIAYQVLSTDVADHLNEYATFKAMGYAHGFFIGIILEEALFLAAVGFWPGFFGAHLIYAMLVQAAGLPIFMSTSRAVLVFLGTLVACSISGMLAIRKLAAADPAELF